MPLATIHIVSSRMHCTQVITGFLMLAESVGAYRGLEIRICDDRAQHAGSPESYVPIVFVNYCGRRIVYDLEDSYWTRGRMRELLRECDVYFKRSFSTAENERHFSPEERAKMFPLGFYLQVDYPGNPFSWGGPAPAGINLKRVVNGIRMLRRPPFTPDALEQPPRQSQPGSSVLFSSRLWDPSEVEERYRADRETINETRIATARALRQAFGTRFVGGIEKSPYALQRCPDLVQPGVQTRRNHYLRAVRQAGICITSTGLHRSTGARFAEFIAASKPIVSEPLCYEVPGEYREGVHYRSFTTPDECVQAVAELLADPAAIEEMQQRNWEYYRNYLRPDEFIARTLRIALETQSGTA